MRPATRGSHSRDRARTGTRSASEHTRQPGPDASDASDTAAIRPGQTIAVPRPGNTLATSRQRDCPVSEVGASPAAGTRIPATISPLRPQRSLSGPVTIRQLAPHGRTDGRTDGLKDADPLETGTTG